MMISIFVVLNAILLCSSTGDNNCNSYVGCMKCTGDSVANGWTCLWCPLDRACHSTDSIFNSCGKGLSLSKPGQCYKTATPKYDPAVSLRNAQLSAAAYSENPGQCLDKILPKDGFKVVKVFTQDCRDLPLFRYKKCVAFIAISQLQKKIVLAFRGTDFSNGNEQLYDELFSVLTTPKKPFVIGGYVQSYFKNAHRKLYPGISVLTKQLVSQYPDYTLDITGHSLGAALASLSAALLIFDAIVPTNTTSLYAYGMPRVGDKQYALQHDKLVQTSWRVVHARDIVSHLPTCNPVVGCEISLDGPYHHGTEIYYPKAEMLVNSTFQQCHGDEDESCSNGAVERRWCLPGRDLSQCIEYHKFYFGFQVGGICDGITRKNYN